jgi:hypothetical protein
VATLTDPAISCKPGEALAALIDEITLTQADAEPDRLRIELYGERASILHAAGLGGAQNDNALRGPCLGPRRAIGGGVVSVVAGACSHLYRTRFSALSRRQQGGEFAKRRLGYVS